MILLRSFKVAFGFISAIILKMPFLSREKLEIIEGVTLDIIDFHLVCFLASEKDIVWVDVTKRD